MFLLIWNLMTSYLWFVSRCCQYLDSVASSVTRIDEWLISKDLEGSRRSLIEVLPRHMPGAVRKTTKYLGQYSRYPDRDFNTAYPEYKPRTLPLHQSVPSSHWYHRSLPLDFIYGLKNLYCMFVSNTIIKKNTSHRKQKNNPKIICIYWSE